MSHAVQAASVASAAATAGAPPLSARRRGLAAWGESAAEVKDDGWAREGWQGSAKTGYANSGAGGGTHRLKVGTGMERALGDGENARGIDKEGTGLQHKRAGLHRLPAKVSQALRDSSAHAGDEISDDVDTAEQGSTGARRGRGLPLAAKSGAAKHERNSEKKARRRPFQPRNDQYVLDALAADVEVKESQLQEEKVQMDIVEKITGYKQVSTPILSHVHSMNNLRLLAGHFLK